MIYSYKFLYIPFFVLLIACDPEPETEVLLCFSNPEISINDACVVNNTLCFSSGDTWTSGFVHIVDEVQCDSNEILSVNSLLAVSYDDESIYSVGMNNNIWRYQNNLWQEFVIDSNLVMRDIEVLDDQIFLVGGLSFFLGYIQTVDKQNLKPLNTTRFDQQLNTVSCTKTGNCVVAGYGAIHFSENYGNSWTLLDHPNDHFMASAVDENDQLYILGSSGRVIRTSDGIELENIRNGSGIAGDFRDMVYNEDVGLVIAGEKGKIEIYDFSNSSWSSISIGNQQDILSVEVLGEHIFVGTRQGDILKFNF